MRKLRKELKRTAAAALAALMVVNTVDFSVFAAEIAGQTDAAWNKTEAVITGFAELEEAVVNQQLSVGASEEEIVFPDSLTVTVSYPEAVEDADHEERESVSEENMENTETESENAASEELETKDNTVSGNDDVQNADENSDAETEKETDENSDEDNDAVTDKNEVPENGGVKEQESESASVLTSLFSAFTPMTVYAAENHADVTESEPEEEQTDENTGENNITKEITLDGITWKIEASESDGAAFDSSEECEGFCYVYTPILPETDSEGNPLTIAEGVELPAIYVLIGEHGTEPVTTVSNITYLDWDENSGQLVEKICDKATELTRNDCNSITLNDGWYVVNFTDERDVRYTISGDVHLIVMDDCSYTVNRGFQVDKGNSLTIYAQSTGNSMGKLIANRSNGSDAPIGGNGGCDYGKITINGGIVTVLSVDNRNSAGIGGGKIIANNGSTYEGGAITINGGIVTASSAYGAGIGGGGSKSGSTSCTGGNSGIITIRGGIVDASSTNADAIGGGLYIDKNDNYSYGSKKTINYDGGLVFENNKGKVYGDFTLNTNYELGSGKTITVGKDASLSIAEGVTLTNNGEISYEAPAEGKGYTIDYANEKIMISQGYEASETENFNGEPITEMSLSEEGNTIYIRAAIPDGTNGSGKIEGAGTITRGVTANTITLSHPAAPELKIDKANEGIVLTNEYYYNFTSDRCDAEGWTQGNGSLVTVEPGNKIYIYKAATENSYKSQVLTLTAPERGTQPTSVKVNIVNSADSEDADKIVCDGRITGMTTDMEYRQKDNGDWMPVTEENNGEITGLTAGTYEVRYKATDADYVSESVEVEIIEKAVVGTQNTGILTYGQERILSVEDKDGNNFSNVDYQWYVKQNDAWTLINSATENAYSTKSLNAGNYDIKCEITDKNGRFVYTWQFTSFTIEQAVPEISDVSAKRNNTTDDTIYNTTSINDVVVNGKATDGNGETVEGSFALAAGTKLEVGKKEYKYVFTPTSSNYSKVEGTVEIEVEQNNVTSITVEKQPEKLGYTYGDMMDLSGAVITAAYADGTTRSLTVNGEDNEVDIVYEDGSNGILKPGQTQVTVSYTYKENDKTVNAVTTTISDINVKYLETPEKIRYNGTNKKDWYGVSDVKTDNTKSGIIITAEGYTISDTLNGDYSNSYVLETSEDSGTALKKLYFKDEDGHMTDGVEISVSYDFLAPTFPDDGGINIKDNWWKKLWDTITFGLFYNDATVDVKVKAEDDGGSGIAAYYYFVDTTGSENVLTIEELKEKTFTESTDATIASISKENKYVYYVYVIDNAGNRSDYICSEGIELDRTAPSKVAVNQTEIRDESAMLTVTATEEGSGIGMYYLVYGTSELTGVTKDNIAKHADVQRKTGGNFELSNLSPNKTYYCAVAVSDKAGNISDVTEYSFTTEKKIPVFDDTEIPTISGTYGNTLGQMTLSATDDTSQNGIEGTWSITEENQQTIYPTVSTSDSYEITFTPKDADSYATVQKKVTPTVEKATLDISVTAEGRTYVQDNNRVNITVKLSGIVIKSSTADEVSLENADSLQGTLNSCNAGNYDKVTLSGLTLTGDDADNYKLSQSSGEITLAKSVTIAKATPTITIPEAEISKTYGDEAFSLGVTDTNTEADVTYTVTDSKNAADESVGNSEVIVVDKNGTVTIKGVGSATIEVSLAESTNYNAAVSKKIEVKVAKKDYNVDAVNRSYYYGRDNADSINLSALLPEDCGNANYTVSTSGSMAYAGVPSVSKGVLSYTVSKGSVDTSGTITIAVTTDNYSIKDITINLKLIDKIPVTLAEGSSVTLKNSVLTYGESLAKLTFKNDAVFMADEKEVKGTLAWKDGTFIPNAGTESATWQFTPDDEAYQTIEKTITITVNKAVPVVETAPTVVGRTYHPNGKLEDDNLTQNPGTVTAMVNGKKENVTGTWSWQTKDIVPTVDNSGYVAVFTPTDSGNYKTVTTPVSVNVSKATPLISVNAVVITYGDTLGAFTLTGGACYAGGSPTIAGSFAWKDASIKPAVADSNSTTYTVVFTPTDKTNYNTVKTDITLTVEKAANAPNMPGSTISASNKCTKISEVSLPDGWEWQKSDSTKALEVGVSVKATAVYTGADKGNYEKESVEITVTRVVCDHINTEVRNAKEATCKETGYTGDTYCKDCEQTIAKGTVIPLADHKGGTATCIEQAICSVCGQKYGNLDAANHVHTELKNYKAATCTAGGYTGDTYCKDCEVKLNSGTTTAALGHHYTSKVTKEPTTTSTGVRTYTCSGCGDSYTETIPKLPEKHSHNYTASITKQPTCTDAGTRTYSCSCGDSYTETIAATGHNYASKVTKEPTKTAEGIMTYTCANCGHTYTKPIAKLQNADTGKPDNSRPDNNKPNDNKPGDSKPGENKSDETTPDTGKSYIKGDADKNGWDIIKEQLDTAKDKDAVTVEMNGATVVPGDILDSIKDKDVNVVFDMGGGISWTVNGKSITAENVNDIDFGVITGNEAGAVIPVDVLNEVTGEKYSMNLTLAYDGEFGFTATLTVNMEAKNSGYYANLFYFNPQSGRLEFVCASQIDKDGNAALDFVHASDYTIVVSKEVMDDTVQTEPDNTQTPTDEQDTQTSSNAETDAWRGWWIVLIGAVIMIVGFGLFFVTRKKRDNE